MWVADADKLIGARVCMTDCVHTQRWHSVLRPHMNKVPLLARLGQGELGDDFGSLSEVEALHRIQKVLFLRLERQRQTHSRELELKATELQTRCKRVQRLDAELKRSKSAKLAVESALKDAQVTAEARAQEASHVRAELRALGRRADAVKKRARELEEDLAAKHDAGLRLRIKGLCRRYHPDKMGSDATVLRSEVVRDLVALMSE